jgi:hypothetical protein
MNARIAALVAATAGVLAGCATPGQPAGATLVGQSPSARAVPASFNAPVPMSPGPGGSADGIDFTMVAPDSTTVRPGGPPMRYSVTLVNTTANDIAQVGMVVSLSHCSCGTPGLQMMPQGSMRMLDPNTNAWVAVPYDREGGGMDFILETLVPPFDLKHGETVTYQLEMRMKADQGFTVNKGGGAIHVTRTNVATHQAIGISPTASLRISVEP